MIHSECTNDRIGNQHLADECRSDRRIDLNLSGFREFFGRSGVLPVVVERVVAPRPNRGKAYAENSEGNQPRAHEARILAENNSHAQPGYVIIRPEGVE